MSNKFAKVWNDLHKNFAKTNKPKYDDWLDEFEYIISNVNTKIIDLGCGTTGNNTLYLLEKNKKVISCDFAQEALNVISKIQGSETLLFDMLETFPFEDEFTDVVIADLSLHYFRDEDTKRILNEIKRILKPNGYLFFRLNSVNSTEYKKLIEANELQIEENLFFSNNMEKRFFSKGNIEHYFKNWKFISLKEENMTRWSSDKIVWKGVVQK